MMKKMIMALCIFICVFTLVACSGQQTNEPLTLGVNAIITEIDKENKIITTKDSGEDFDARFVADGDGRILLNKTTSGNGDGTLKANLLGNASSADYATETQIDREQTVDLSSLDTNTWYPVVTNCGWPGLHHIKCNVHLNSGTKPSWSTHSSGFTAVVELLTLSPGWGTTGGHCICLCNDQRFISDSSKPPVGYTMMWNGSMCVFWLRGGGRYHLYADYKTTQSLQTSSYTNNEQTVSPTTSYPGVSINRSTITADINGNATTAGIATTGVMDYNNANNTIKIGWSGADLDANTLAYVAGYTSDMKIHTASKDGVRSWLGNGVSASGQNYVRFGDGTQICWGSCGNNSFSLRRVTPVVDLPPIAQFSQLLLFHSLIPMR